MRLRRIASIVDEPTTPAPVVAFIRSITGRSVGEVTRDLRSGLPVVEYALFQNDHDVVADRLRRLGRELTRAGAPVRVYELDEAETYGDLDEPSEAEIPLAMLFNILDSHERELERQQELSAEGR